MGRLKQTIYLAMFLTIITTLEIMMSYLPNISLTPLIFALYFTNYRNGLLLISGYIILQGIIWGFGFYLISMFIGWVIWWGLSKNGKNLTTKSVLFSFVYGWSFLPLTWLIYRIDPVTYLISDIPFQINMAVSNIATIGFLFPALDKVIKKL
jgi:hypothetical protein